MPRKDDSTPKSMRDALSLEERDGLPEALRVLLHSLPRETWEHHPQFHGLVSFWLDRHLMFRRLMGGLRRDAEAEMDARMEMAALQARLSRQGGMLVQQLHGHHEIEDTHYFPVLQGFDPRLQAGFDILDRDHHALDGLIDGFIGAANGVLQGQLETGRYRDELLRFERLLSRHLEDEEDLIVPVILKYGAGHLS